MAEDRKKTFTGYSISEILDIHALSVKRNASGCAHADKLMEMIKEHALEIEELLKAKDPHCCIETGDLAVLCLELLVEKGADPDKVMRNCYKRFRKKLT
jgi:phosphoribosyl-ATP pyrophosphohydrolase